MYVCLEMRAVLIHCSIVRSASLPNRSELQWSEFGEFQVSGKSYKPVRSRPVPPGRVGATQKNRRFNDLLIRMTRQFARKTNTSQMEIDLVYYVVNPEIRRIEFRTRRNIAVH